MGLLFSKGLERSNILNYFCERMSLGETTLNTEFIFLKYVLNEIFDQYIGCISQ